MIGLFPICLLGTVFKSYAFHEPAPRTATFDKIRGVVRVYPNRSSLAKTPEQHRILRSSATTRDQVWIQGDDKGWAHLQFWSNQAYNSRKIGPLVQVGPDRVPTKYTLACHAYNKGRILLGWGLTPRGSSACERIVIGHPDWKSSTNSIDVAEKSSLKELKQDNPDIEVSDPPLNSITVERSDELTLIYAYGSEDKLVVDVLVGGVKISSTGDPITVEAGIRYVYSEGGEVTVRGIDTIEISQSQPVQTFLETANWSEDVRDLIEKFREILIADSPLTPEQQEILNVHNKLREEVGVPPLRWSNQLASYAQDWANELSRRGESQLVHSPGNNRSGAGENIAAGSSVTLMLNLWANEKDDYDYATNNCRGDKCGHYTQMVWSNTTEIGCGIAPHRRYRNVMVCNYSPPGNYRGQRPY
ncbi:MAG: hypothetical protein F6K14_22615 [Symploca sp. SIO2C1]|nr:hypothetical protein [Symploca sp. SIO2C1]